jgi:PAS domain S-box-containing protein
MVLHEDSSATTAEVLYETNQTLQAIIQASPLAIVVLDREAHVKLWNTAAERIYGWSAAEVLNRPLPTVPADQQVELAQNHAAALAGYNFNNYETKRRRKDGTLIDVALSTAPMRNAAGETTGVMALVADITERKRAEEKLSLLAAIVESSEDAILSKNLAGTILSWNPSAERLYGYTETEIIGQSVMSLIPADRPDEEPSIIERIKRGERVDHFETVRLRKDGTLVDVSVTVSPVKDAQGQIIGASNIARDITERKRAEAYLQRQSRLIELSFEPIFLWDFDGGIVEWNTGAEQLYGYSRAEAIGRNSHELLNTIHPLSFAEFRAVLEQEREWTGELRQTTKDGRAVIIESRQQLIMIDAQRLILETNRDITERKRAEAELQRIEERNQALLDAIPDLMFRLSRAGHFLDVHATRADELLLLPHEFIGKHVAEVMPPQIAQETLEYIERAAATHELQVYEYELSRADKVYNYEARVVASGADEVIFIVRDVTNRKRREAAQRFLSDTTTALATSLDYDQTLEHIARLSVPYMADCCLVDMLDEDTGAILRMVVVHRDPTKEEPWREMQRRWPLDPAADYTIPKVLRTGQPEIYPELTAEAARTVLTDEEHIQALLSFGIKSSMIVPLKARGRTLGAITFLRTESAREYRPDDLTLAEELARRAALAIDNARLYNRAQEANRAKDEFLATLSHELRTPLTPIIGWVHMLSNGPAAPADLAHGLSVIDKNSQALARLINDLLDMSAILNGKMRIDRLPVTLNNVIKEAVETVRQQADARHIEIELHMCAEREPLFVSGDRTRLGQIFWNLINNAIKFSRDNGHVRVRCTTDESEVCIQVEDEGIGIVPEFLPHVFARFRQADMSTTKAHGGLGIGLALVKNFVEAHGGTVTAESAGAGRGSRFTVRLPRLQLPAAQPVGQPDVAAASARVAPTQQSQPKTAPRLLIVDDAEDTLELLRMAFTARGYRVTTCGGAEAACAIAAREHFDIIISDIGLPKIDGYELLARLRAEQPRLRTVPAIALTGYAAVQDVELALRAGFAAHIAKPVDPTTLARVVEQLLAQQRAAVEEK